MFSPQKIKLNGYTSRRILKGKGSNINLIFSTAQSASFAAQFALAEVLWLYLIYPNVVAEDCLVVAKDYFFLLGV